jgi:DnaJ-class molecular chaperone
LGQQKWNDAGGITMSWQDIIKTSDEKRRQMMENSKRAEYIRDTKECPECKGKGEVHIPELDDAVLNPPYMTDCQKCKGTGRIEE